MEVYSQQESVQFAQILETLNVLNKSSPFHVHFVKDHTMVGRVIAFNAGAVGYRGYGYRLKVFVEYPCCGLF